MKRTKKLFFKLHSWIGTRLSILFFIVCFSGTLATLSHEMDWLFNPAMRAKPQKELASRNLIVSNFKEKYPGATIKYWMRPEEPYLCDIIYKIEEEQLSYVFANRYTGAIQGESALTIQRFFRDLHYYLFIPFQVGNFLVLIFGFMLFVSLVTALFFYKKWWHKLFELQTGKGALVFFRSLHRLVGLWSVPFSLLFSITGIWYFMERANIGGIGEAVNPKPPELSNAIPAAKSGDLMFSIDYDKAVALAQKEIPGLVAGNLYVPQKAGDVLGIVGTGTVPLVRQRANRVYINPESQKLIGLQKASEIDSLMWFNDVADPLHFGYWGGLLTKVIWFFFGCGISSLVLSGIWITCKRQRIKRKKSGKPIMGKWRFVNWGLFGVLMACMYAALITRYHVPLATYMYISLGWMVFVFLSWYIFERRLKHVVDKA